MLQIANFSTKEEVICICTQATILEKCSSYAPINIKPQDGGGGGGAYPGEFDIFRKARVKFPTPGQLMNVKFQPQGSESQIVGAPCMFKIFTQGIKIDRCIRKESVFRRCLLKSLCLRKDFLSQLSFLECAYLFYCDGVFCSGC